MQKFILTLIILITMSLSTFSQKTYPYKILNGKDTSFVLSKEQFIKVNLNLVRVKELTELNTNLDNRNKLFEKEIINYKEIDSLLNINLNLKDTIIANNDFIIIEKIKQLKKQKTKEI